MATPGPKKLPAAILELRGARKSTIAQRRAEEQRHIPPPSRFPPPPHLGPAGTRLWTRMLGKFAYEDEDPDLENLEILCMAREKVETFAQMLQWLDASRKYGTGRS